MNNKIKWKKNNLNYLDLNIWRVSLLSCIIITSIYFILLGLFNEVNYFTPMDYLIVLTIIVISSIFGILPLYIINYYNIGYPDFLSYTLNSFIVKKKNRIKEFYFNDITELYIVDEKDFIVSLKNSSIPRGYTFNDKLLLELIDNFKEYIELKNIPVAFINNKKSMKIILKGENDSKDKSSKYIYYSSLFIIFSGIFIMIYNSIFFYYYSDYYRIILYLPLPIIIIISGIYLLNEINKRKNIWNEHPKEKNDKRNKNLGNISFNTIDKN